ncbi:hypothetical protein [Cellulomonas soli]|uniref:Uncharacterized protein n=1 Tax=Cellulomonas soli TaxID=931535 RepID=A0A512PGT8_9CELL|nr:hypothetical protein [Cellulomonas soli]NYI59625.1 hypothetical protein [Cellulomonas soli]GEP70419.1 hypothetical protein CSO01_31340 [Cellulomonas soli]
MSGEMWRLDVDADRFSVVERAPGTYDLTWETGPNPGYGFTIATSDRNPLSRGRLEEEARGFLRQVDAETGYLE